MKRGLLQLEEAAYHRFLTLWNCNKFHGMRLGQAFYNYFKLHRLANQDHLLNLYEKDGDDAFKIIEKVFEFN